VADDGLADHDAAGRTARASVFCWRVTCYPRPRAWPESQTRLNKSDKLAFNPLAIFPMLTSDTFLIPRSIPL
jgi:hypothetical protein